MTTNITASDLAAVTFRLHDGTEFSGTMPKFEADDLLRLLNGDRLPIAPPEWVSLTVDLDDGPTVRAVRLSGLAFLDVTPTELAAEAA